jgi:hypothetical protein
MAISDGGPFDSAFSAGAESLFRKANGDDPVTFNDMVATSKQDCIDALRKAASEC